MVHCDEATSRITRFSPTVIGWNRFCLFTGVSTRRLVCENWARRFKPRVWIRDAWASVYVNSVSGDQRVEAVFQGAVEAHAVSGDIRVGVRRGSRVYVDANTISGSTNSELELSDAPQESEPAEDAPMVEVRAKTVSGDITIARAPAPAPAELPAS